MERKWISYDIYFNLSGLRPFLRLINLLLIRGNDYDGYNYLKIIIIIIIIVVVVIIIIIETTEKS